MANLDCIVTILNDHLKATAFKDKRFQKAAMYGIAKTLPHKKGDVYELLPAVLDDLGEGTVLAPDDKNPVQCYHKVNGITNALDKSQYGNGNSNIIRTAAMSMIVFGQRKLLKLTEHELDLFIMVSFLNKLTKAQLSDLQLKDCTINYTSTDFNSMSIFAREYNTKTY